MLHYFRINPSFDRLVKGVALLGLLWVANLLWLGVQVTQSMAILSGVCLLMCLDWFVSAVSHAARAFRRFV